MHGKPIRDLWSQCAKSELIVSGQLGSTMVFNLLNVMML